MKAPILSRSGYGEQSRIALRALRTREDLFDIYLVSINWGKTGFITQTDSEEFEWINQKLADTAMYIQQEGQFDLSFQTTIPNEFENIAPVNIGFTAGIETDRIAPQWIQKCNEVDKIITISEHSRKVLAETSYQVQHQQTGEEVSNYRIIKPIEAINYPVYHHEMEPIDLNFSTSKNFLVVSQWGPRKNLENTVMWFIDVFKDDEEVGLVLKTNTMSDCIMDRELTTQRLQNLLQSTPERKCKIYLLHGELTPGQLTWLYRHDTMKALVNIGYGEGYGLPLFEAAYNGLPLVTVTWSGQMDFICKPNKKGKRVPLVSRVDHELKTVQPECVWNGVITEDARWAYAREASYKRALREVLTKEKHFQKQAKVLQKHILENFTEEKIYEQYVDAIYGEKIPKIDVGDLPKISLITSVYKAADHIEQLMEDITRQTIFEEKCEWILLNANEEGENAEEEVILKFAEKYPNNIVYKRLEKDPGIYGTWNIGAKMATGEFLTNVNCDDRSAPDRLQKQAMLLVRNPEIDLAYCDSYIVHEPNTMWEDVPEDAQRYNFEVFSKEAMLRGNLPHNNPVWRKSLHDVNGYFDEQYGSAGDWEFFLRCAFAGSTFAKCPEILGVYYFNPTGISTNPDNNDWKRKEERSIFQKYLIEHQKQQEG